MPVLELEPKLKKATKAPANPRRRPALQPDELARLAASKREGQFRELIALHGESVLARCMRVTRDRHDAEDAAQQTFIALAKRIAEDPIRGPIDRPQAWLTRVAKRCAIDVVRARSSRRTHESAAATHRPARQLQDADGALLLRRTVAR
jgi:DNA-directed RNA polymerase specialized sigma24 family protein